MRNHTRSAAIALFMVIPAVVAWTTIADGKLELAPQSRLWVDGTSSVRDWTCTAGLVEADVVTTSEGAVTQVASGTKGIGFGPRSAKREGCRLKIRAPMRR